MKIAWVFLGMGLLPGWVQAESAATAKVVGQIGLISGTVLLDSVTVKKGAPVKEGAVIEVKSGSKATLILGKGSVFQIGADSKMIVGEYGISPEREELANLDLKFGRTRALILNQGPKRELKIKTRAATMGVRGTEVFVESPKEISKPVQFFTIEGLAEVKFGDSAPAIPLPQNQGIESGTKSESQDESGRAEAPPPAPKPLNPVEVKAALSQGGLQPESSALPGNGGPLPPPPPAANRGGVGGLSDGFAVGPSVPMNLDPLQDGAYRPVIRPVFCDAASGCP